MFTNVRSYIRSLNVRLDVRIILIVLLITVSTGHVGRLFADREDERQAFVGYVLALSIDGVMAVALYEAANVRKRSHKAFALSMFVLTCAVSAGFNFAYYRQNYPTDPPEISVLLGMAAPVLAALVAVLRAIADEQRTEDLQAEHEAEHEAERSLELEKYRIEQAERTRRLGIEQQERTKRERAKARAERAKAEASAARAKAVANTGTNGRKKDNGRLSPGELDSEARVLLESDPDIGPRPLARMLGVAPSTAAGILGRIRDDNGREAAQ